MDEQTLRKVVKDVLEIALEPLKEDVSTLKETVINIEQTMTSYGDSYKINQLNIERLDTRLSTVEEEMNIEVPEQLKVPNFSSQK